MSQEKISMLRAFGAEVVITPTAVEPDRPSPTTRFVAARRGDPRRVQPDQYSNPANPRGALRDDRPGDLGADRRRDRRARVSVGTGGTISGVGRYFKERKPGGADRRRRPEGSIYTAS